MAGLDPFAEPSDVIAVFRPLSSAEETLATGLLAQASLKLRLEARRVGADIGLLLADELSGPAIKATVVNAVKRVLMNPEAVRQLSITTGPMSESRTTDTAISSGLLYLDSDDLADIFPPRPKSVMRSFRIKSGFGM